MTELSRVPFSPIPTHDVPMKFEADSTFELPNNPMVVAWREAYRLAAIHLNAGDDGRARFLARLGLDMEMAYLRRSNDERHAELETEATRAVAPPSARVVARHDRA